MEELPGLSAADNIVRLALEKGWSREQLQGCVSDGPFSSYVLKKFDEEMEKRRKQNHQIN